MYIKTENNNVVFAISGRFVVDAVTGIILSCFAIIGNGIFLFEANSIFLSLFFASAFVFALFLGLYSVCALIRCRITISGTIITVQRPFYKDEVDISRFDSYDILDNGWDYNITFYNSKNTWIQKQSINTKLIEEKDRFTAYISEYLVCLDKKDLQMKKRFFPGTDTLAERKRFAVFHACTLIIVPIIVALVIAILNWRTNTTRWFIVDGFMPPLSLFPFSNLRDWLLWSLAVWSFIGSLRFCDDADKDMGFFVGRGVMFICLFIFPLIYLYNLWCLIIKKTKEKN